MARSSKFLILLTVLSIFLLGCISIIDSPETLTTEIIENSNSSGLLTTGIVPNFNSTDKICVLPIIFIPADVPLPNSEISSSKKLLGAHMELAQGLYHQLLNTTFCVREAYVYKSPNKDAYFATASDSGSRMLNELFEINHENRYNSNSIYLILYARSENWNGRLFGGGRTFNGPPNSGGGYVEMEYTSLTRDFPYSFQSTVVHELGHSFGLTHPNCFGHNLTTSESIMSYNPKHKTNGLAQSNEPGIFTPEEYFELSLNKRVFPDFNYISAIYDPDKEMPDIDTIQNCFLGPMNEGIGEYMHFPSVGYELFFNGDLVNGPGSHLFSLKQAQDNCKWNYENHNDNDIEIECRFNGQVFYKSAYCTYKPWENSRAG